VQLRLAAMLALRGVDWPAKATEVGVVVVGEPASSCWLFAVVAAGGDRKGLEALGRGRRPWPLAEGAGHTTRVPLALEELRQAGEVPLCIAWSGRSGPGEPTASCICGLEREILMARRLCGGEASAATWGAEPARARRRGAWVAGDGSGRIALGITVRSRCPSPASDDEAQPIQCVRHAEKYR
jgi:hypothetical protein